MRVPLFTAVMCLLMSSAALADDASPWRLSAYGGVATRNDTTEVFLHGHFQILAGH